MALAIISGLTPSRRRMYAIGVTSLRGDAGISEAIVSSAWIIAAAISGYDRVVPVVFRSLSCIFFFPFDIRSVLLPRVAILVRHPPTRDCQFLRVPGRLGDPFKCAR